MPLRGHRNTGPSKESADLLDAGAVRYRDKVMTAPDDGRWRQVPSRSR